MAGGLLGVAVTAMLTGAASPAPRAGATTPTARPAAQTIHHVTLITGDVVTVEDIAGGKQAVTVQRPAGAIGGVATYTLNKDVYVIPDEAMSYVAAQKVDRRLFDVTALIRDGYDDAHSDGVPLLVSYTGGAKSLPGGVKLTRTLPSIKGAAVRAPKSSTRAFWKSLAKQKSGPAQGPRARSLAQPTSTALGDGVAHVWLDGKVKTTMTESNAQIGTATAWAAGYDGTGVKVAMLDTGYDTDHPDLVGRVAAAQSFVPGETVEDAFGHGTHVLSTIGGSGAASGGAEKGVAPGASLMVGKVLGDDGYGQDSWIIAGMEWAAHNGARVISMSLGSYEPYDGTDIESVAVNQLTAETGALFVIAAGNSGCPGCIGSPGAADAALTVGAVDSNDQLAWFSSTGPRYGDYGLKPDITAPGVGILAAKMGGTAEDGYYTEMDGTSMATPHVAGVAALLAQEHPDWKADQIKNAIMSTAKQLPDYTIDQVGAGRVSVPDVINATVTATGSQYFGFFSWPHTGDAAVDKTVTYNNDGDAPITLHLAESVAVSSGPYDPTSTDAPVPVGQAAPDGMFSLSSNTVTVPAHGNASVTALANPDQGLAGARYTGKIVASDGAGTVLARTDVGLYLEDARYNVNVKVTDRAGRPAGGTLIYHQVGSLDMLFADIDPETGVAKARWRAGTYDAFMFMDVQGDNGPDSTGVALLGNPEFTVDHDTSLVLDARKAVHVTATAPGQPQTQTRFRQMEWYRNGGDAPMDAAYLLPDTYDDMYVLPTKKTTIGDFEYSTRWRLAKPILTVAEGKNQLWTVDQFGTGYLDGSAKLAAVYAGTASAPALGGVRGKVAVIAVDSTDFDPGALVAQAAAAGARMVVLANTLGGKLYSYVADADGNPAAIPVVSVATTVATGFLARVKAGKVKLDLVGTPNTPWVYDLQDAHPNGIPAHLDYRPTSASLATVNMRFYGTTATSGGEFRWDYRPFRNAEFAFPQRQNMPGTRTDYVSTEAGSSWYENVFAGPNLLNMESRAGDLVTYKAGQQVTRNWFSPVEAPRNGMGFWVSYRDPYNIYTNLQPWSDGQPGSAGTMDANGSNLDYKMYKDGVLVSEQTEWASAWMDVSGDTGTSTLTLDLTASRDPKLWPTSTRTHTVWTVKSSPSSGDNNTLPVLQIAYQVTTDLAGNRAGGVQALSLQPYHLDGAVGAGTVGTPKFEVSFNDGKTWIRVPVVKVGGSYLAIFTAPKSGFVSLRTTASDSKGNAVTQTVIRAYGLSKN